MTQASTSDSSQPRLELSPERIPQHVAIIMDGNGRWARRNSLPRIEGHRRGAQTVINVVRECEDLGVKQLTLYCLSNENWKRPQEELDVLIQLFHQYLIEIRSTLIEGNYKLRIIGRRDKLPELLQAEMDKTLKMTAANDGFCVCLAVNYGARQEIVDAVQAIGTKIASKEMRVEDIDEERISEHLYTAGMPDPDLLIRTAGEMRVSNYLLWQISYAELWVTERCWPEFRIADLHQAFRDFDSRERRFGGLLA